MMLEQFPSLHGINRNGLATTLEMIERATSKFGSFAPALSDLRETYQRELRQGITTLLPAVIAMEFGYNKAAVAILRHIGSQRTLPVRTMLRTGIAIEFYPDNVTVRSAYWCAPDEGCTSWDTGGGWIWYANGKLGGYARFNERLAQVEEITYWPETGTMPYKDMVRRGKGWQVVEYFPGTSKIKQQYKLDGKRRLHGWFLEMHGDGDLGIKRTEKYKRGLLVDFTRMGFYPIDGEPAGYWRNFPHGERNWLVF